MGRDQCCINGCGNRYKKGSKECRLFSPPKSQVGLKRWTAATGRRSGFKLTNNTKICQAHFDEDCFIKGTYTSGPDGTKVLQKEFKTWRLTDDAVPTKKMGRPDQHLSPRKRKSSDRTYRSKKRFASPGRKYPSPCNSNNSSMDEADSSAHSETLLLSDKTLSISSDEGICNESLGKGSVENEEPPAHDSDPGPIDPLRVTLPPEWKYIDNKEEGFYFVKLVIQGDNVVAQRAIRLIENVVKYCVNGHSAEPNFLAQTCQSLQELNDILKNFDACPLCEGCPEKEVKLLHLESAKEYLREDHCWRPSKCEHVVIPGEKKCQQCVCMTRALTKSKKKILKSPKEKKTQVQLKNMRKKNQRAITKIMAMKKEIIKLGEKLKQKAEKMMKEQLTDLHPKEKIIIETILKRSKFGNSKSMKFDAGFVMDCVLLRIKSKSTYLHLRKAKLLPLPSLSTLRRYISCMPCSFGINQFALNAIGKALANQSKALRLGSLMWDEMAIETSLDFDAQKLRFEGFVDYGDGNITPQKDQLADHALVYIFRPYRFQWIQPVAVFATHGAAPGEILFDLMMKVIVALYKQGAIVKSVVCDGATSNKKAMMLAGIDGTMENPKNSFEHPGINEKVYCIFDVPHIFKCIRNNMVNHGITQCSGKEIDFSWFRKLADRQREFGSHDGQGCSLRLCDKLSEAHINPSAFEKMSVKLMAQLFSRRVYDAFVYFSQHETTTEEFEGSKDIRELVLALNDCFDVMNGRWFAKAIHPNTWKKSNNPNVPPQKETLEKMLELLWDTELAKNSGKSNRPMFLSETTMYALRISILSTIELTEELFGTYKYKYVLSGKLNQDCVERFFGIIRQHGCGSDNPTVTSFLQLFRMLCIYYPISDAITKGNITNEERMTLLESYTKCMNHNFKDISREAAEKRKDLQDILFKNLCFKASGDLPVTSNGFDHIVYDLCGFLLYARSKLIDKITDNCRTCKTSLETKKELLPKDFYAGKLVEVRERFGGLKYCTPNMLTLFCEVEKTIQDHFHTEDGYLRDSFGLVIEQISKLTLPAIGCTLHREVLVPRLIYEYVVIRYRFQAKQEKKDRLEKSKSARKGKRKLSKIVKSPAKKLKSCSSSRDRGKKKAKQTDSFVVIDASFPLTDDSKAAPAQGRPAEDLALSSTNEIIVVSQAKKRGRPPKDRSTEIEAASSTEKQPVLIAPELAKAKRGRPRKNPVANDTVIQSSAAVKIGKELISVKPLSAKRVKSATVPNKSPTKQRKVDSEL